MIPIHTPSMWDVHPMETDNEIGNPTFNEDGTILLGQRQSHDLVYDVDLTGTKQYDIYTINNSSYCYIGLSWIYNGVYDKNEWNLYNFGHTADGKVHKMTLIFDKPNRYAYAILDDETQNIKRVSRTFTGTDYRITLRPITNNETLLAIVERDREWYPE